MWWKRRAGGDEGTKDAVVSDGDGRGKRGGKRDDASAIAAGAAAQEKMSKRRGRKGTWRSIRADYQHLPRTEWTEDEEAHWWSTCSEEEYWAEWERWSLETFEHPKIRRIKADCLDMALEAARETDAQAIADSARLRDDGGAAGAEFACLLKVEKDTITELVLLPGTISGDEHAIFNLWMQPVDKTVRGSLHSHPDEHPYPSDADFELFEHHGEVHLILCRPYGPDDWRAYMHDGTPCFLEVVE